MTSREQQHHDTELAIVDAGLPLHVREGMFWTLRDIEDLPELGDAPAGPPPAPAATSTAPSHGGLLKWAADCARGYVRAYLNGVAWLYREVTR